MDNAWAIALLLAGLTGAEVAGAADWYVAPNGNDGWSGRLPAPNTGGTDGPLATLRAAREAARKAGAPGTRRIAVRGGAYCLAEPLVLGPQDSGLTITALPGEHPVLYGGRRLAGWERDGERFWAVRLPEVAAGKWDFRLLVVNGRLCRRARLPRTGTFTHLSEFRVPWMSTTGGGWQRPPTPDELTHLRYKPEDVGPWLDLKNAELTVYHMWDESVVGLAARDEATHTLTFSNPAGHPPGAFGVQKYVVWNVREGMAEPGQWYLDRSAGKVVYWPLPGEDMARAEAFAPLAESILRLEGTKEAPVRDVTVRGLQFSVTNTPLAAGGFGALRFEGAVAANLAEGCRLLDLTLSNVAGQAIKAQNCTRLEVRNCDVHDTGACGIFVGGTENLVSGNLVHHIGALYPSAIGLWGEGRGTTISHNEIHNTPYTAIACGGEDHRIEGNLISHSMEELHDGGGIYITFCKRIVVRGNFVHDIADTGGYGASAYYLDEQAEDCVVEGNLSRGVVRAMLNHMAKNNTIRGNVFVTSGDMTLMFPKSTGFTLEKNVLSSAGKITFANAAAIAKATDNLLFSATGVVEDAPPGSHLADPLLEGTETGKCRFKPGSPAAGLGILALDVSGAGRGR